MLVFSQSACGSVALSVCAIIKEVPPMPLMNCSLGLVKMFKGDP